MYAEHNVYFDIFFIATWNLVNYAVKGGKDNKDEDSDYHNEGEAMCLVVKSKEPIKCKSKTMHGCNFEDGLYSNNNSHLLPLTKLNSCPPQPQLSSLACTKIIQPMMDCRPISLKIYLLMI